MIDTQGNVVIEPIYDNAFPFHEGKAIVYNKEEEKWIVIDVNGKKLFEINSGGYQQYSHALYHNDYCLIENFLLDEKGNKAQRFPPDIYNISPFINNVALYRNSKTGLWGQINVRGEKIGEAKYPLALGIVDDWIYVGDTISSQRDELDNPYMNVYALNPKGEIQTEIENVSCFYPLSKSIIMAENDKYYFADKKGKPINNNFYYKISVPPFTDAPSNSSLWSFLIAPHAHADYNAWGVVTNYIDEEKTIGSIFEKLTTEGIGTIKMGHTFSQLADLFNLYNDNNYLSINSYDDWLFLRTKDYGINNIYATYAVCGIINWSVRIIKVKINTNSIPVDNASEKIAEKIPSYLTQTLGMTKIKYGNSYLYRSEKYSYDIIYYDGETTLLLMSKSITEDLN